MGSELRETRAREGDECRGGVGAVMPWEQELLICRSRKVILGAGAVDFGSRKIMLGAGASDFGSR